MNPVLTMLGVATVVGVLGRVGFGAGPADAVAWGVAGPLVVSMVSWRMAERVYRRQPSALTGVMVAGFVGKMVFFGAYVAVALMVFHLAPVPFAVSFTGAFIALYLVEALALKRLFAA